MTDQQPSTEEIQIAESLGRLAAKYGKHYSECPYDANGAPAQRVLAARFIAAYDDAGGKLPTGEGDPTDPRDFTTHDTPKGPVRVTITRKPA